MEKFMICKNCELSGIYAIRNINNGKMYIGSSNNILNRLRSHKTLLKTKKHTNKYLQDDYNNGDCFETFVVTEISSGTGIYSRRELSNYERMAISILDTGCNDKGYNIADVDYYEIIKNMVKFKDRIGV